MIYLRPFSNNDFDRLISWTDSAETLMQFAGPAFHFPLTHEQLEQSLNEKNRLAFVVVEKRSNEAIGHAEIYRTNKIAFLGRLLIGDKQKRAKGLGTAIVAELLRLVFEEMNFSLAELNVFNWNTAAIRCYEKAGFVVNPEKKLERNINGQTWSALNMILSKTNWQERVNKE